MQTSRLLSRTFLGQAVSRKFNKTALPTMNEFPTPKGDWKTNYDALNRRYNLHLLLGIAVFGGTLAFGQVTGLLYMYNDYPEVPAPIENYKDL